MNKPQRQMETPYEKLSEKDSDREQADKLLAVVRDQLTAMTARAKAAEAKLAAVDQYGENQWESGWRWNDARRPEDVPVSFAEWLAQQSEVEP